MRAWAAYTMAGLLAALAAGPAAVSADISPPQTLYRGSVADVAASSDGLHLYMAAYAQDAVLQLDATTGEVRARWPVGRGPTALAFSRPWLVCLNRMDGSVSFINVETGALAGTVAVGTGARAIAALSGHRVAVVDAFGHEVAIVDARTLRVERRFTVPAGVPVAAAMFGDTMAVATRAPNGLLFFDAESFGVVQQLELSSGPVELAIGGSDRIAVLTQEDIVFVDAVGEAVLVSNHVAGRFFGSGDGRLFVGRHGELVELDRDGSLGGRRFLPQGAHNALVLAGRTIAWDTTSGTVWLLGAREPASDLLAQNQPPVTGVDAGPGSPSISPAVPTPESATEPLRQADAAAASIADEQSEHDARADETEASAVNSQPAEDVSGRATQAERLSQREQTEIARRNYRYGLRPPRIGLGGISPYAPRFGDPTGRTFNRELARALEFDEDDGSLALLEWGAPLQGLTYGGTWSGVFGAREEFSGGVNFHVDDVDVQSERLVRIVDPLELILQGDVDVERGASSLEAARLRYYRPEAEPLPAEQRLVPAEGERPMRHPLVPHGYREPEPSPLMQRGVFEGTDILWREPGRRLRAGHLSFDAAQRTGELENVEGFAGPLYIGAERLRVLGPADASAEEFWVTTCDLPTPHYRLRMSRAELEDRERVVGTNARLQVGRVNTPLYLPRVTTALVAGKRRRSTEIDFGRQAEIGFFMDVAQWFRLTDHLDIAPRFYPTSEEGIGAGLDGEYNFMNDPMSWWYRSAGRFQTLYTSEDRGYAQWYHRQEMTPDTVVLAQVEQWSDGDFVKDFYNEVYENRTGPRTFVNLTHVQPEYIAAATVAKSTHDFTRESEKLPEGSFHLLERRIGGRLYGTFDGAAGYYRTAPDTVDAGRVIGIGRLSYDMNLKQGLNLTPFIEADGTYYTDTLDPDSNDAFRTTMTAGVTAQMRMQRAFPGRWGFSGFKHLIIPSTTFSYRPDATVDADETPRFDDFDDRPGRTRVESTLDNIVLGRNASTGQVWPVARATFYHGNDLTNETVKAQDYELEVQVRPRPWWGVQTVGEIHNVDDDPNVPGEDFDRVLAYVFYDNALGRNNFNGRVGFALTEAGDNVLNQEVLYGAGYKLSEGWSVAFEHRYDIERSELTRQSYAIRRKLHKWELGLRLRERETGFDIGFEINLTDFREIGLGL